HNLRTPKLLVAVDQEGGRVQRFRQEFTELPPAAVFGSIYDEEPIEALRLAEQCAWLLAQEIAAVGVDFSFAPVLDRYNRSSTVINDRAFHEQVEVVVDIARAFIAGLHSGGVAAVGKHFPGHGTVIADSHHELPVDDRSYYDISAADLIPFRRLAQKLEGMMPAHVLYPQVDRLPAGFSKVWIKDILRGECDFKGAVFSDDLSMKGAHAEGDIFARADAAKNAGCDMLLVCNDRPAVKQLLVSWKSESDPLSQVRLIRLHGKTQENASEKLRQDDTYLAIKSELESLNQNPSLNLGDDAPA
ncbi:MAG: beta-N-acetylhexosaminidase, partial [Pseudomonadota bacterium]